MKKRFEDRGIFGDSFGKDRFGHLGKPGKADAQKKLKEHRELHAREGNFE